MSSSIKLPHFPCFELNPSLRAMRWRFSLEMHRWRWRLKQQEASCKGNNQITDHAKATATTSAKMLFSAAASAYEVVRDRPDRPSGAGGAVGDRMPAGCCCTLLANICALMRHTERQRANDGNGVSSASGLCAGENKLPHLKHGFALLFPRSLGALLIWSRASSTCGYLICNLVDNLNACGVGDNRSEIVHHGVHYFDLMRLVGPKVNALQCDESE
jgi:hypothetical protein